METFANIRCAERGLDQYILCLSALAFAGRTWARLRVHWQRHEKSSYTQLSHSFIGEMPAQDM